MSRSSSFASALGISGWLTLVIASPLLAQQESDKVPGGFPDPATVGATYDAADLNRAIEAYKFFYPTVSGVAMFAGNEKVDLVDNQVFGYLDTKPRHVGFTLNSDTPYGPMMLDLSGGPLVVEVPPGPLIVVAMDVNQRWVADMGIPGPDEGKGGKHVLLPPDYQGDEPEDHFVWDSTTNRLLVGVRSLPVGGDVEGALKRIQTVKVYPLEPRADWVEPKWIDLTDTPLDMTPLAWEDNLGYWQELHEAIDQEPAFEGYRNEYGLLASLGIEKGKPFAPDERMKGILEQAAQTALAQMRNQSFADRRPDGVVWPDRKWEWVGLRQEDGDFNAENYVDAEAREVWFYQAIGASPSMFRRKAGSGSLYWLGHRDATGAYLDGGKTYKLTIPQPVPAGLFWSVTVYDAQTRSQIATDQGFAALRSLFELKDSAGQDTVDLYFGPEPPAGGEGRWIKTIPGKGWFVYFRIYGPQAAAFDGSWKPGDFERVER